MIKTITDKIIAVEIPNGAKNIEVSNGEISYSHPISMVDFKDGNEYPQTVPIWIKLPEGKWEIMGMRDELTKEQAEDMMYGKCEGYNLLRFVQAFNMTINKFKEWCKENSLTENTIFLQQVNE